MIAHAVFYHWFAGRETKVTLHETEKVCQKYEYYVWLPLSGAVSRYNCKKKLQDYDLEILTDNWSLYDANDAIVKTSALLPQDMREFGARYDEEMETGWRKKLQGYAQRHKYARG